jgi:monovalent cation:H+ antiporter-2, CPA2 family
VIHLPQLIQDLGIILVTAAVVTIIFKKLKQPAVLGYLIAGLLLGPHVAFMPTVKDVSSVKVWAEIGVIILLFGLGLEFSFKKLAKVGKTSSITALFEIVFMMSVGFIAGRLLGWHLMDSLFLGGMLAISSTTIIVRAIDELGMKSRKFTSLVFGVLIVEDIVAILLLVLLSTVAISQTLSGVELLTSTARLGFFLLLWFVMGIYLLPTFINKTKNLLSDETILVVSLGLCLLMVIIASKVGFSPALGAFIMGSLLCETREGERIEKLIHPVRDLFAAVFFVSVGMLIEPKYIIEYKYQILLITAVTIAGKFLSSFIGSLISGQSMRHSVQVGMSLAQIGEFSFIIATLGVSLNVTSSYLYPIAVAVSAITTFTTPYMIKWADGLSEYFEEKTPDRFKTLLQRYQVAVQTESGSSGMASLLWQAFGWRLVLNTIVVVALFLFSQRYLLVWVNDMWGAGYLSSLVLTIGTLIVASPFIWAITFGIPELEAEDVARLEKLMFGIRLARAFFALNLVAFFINVFLSINSWIGMAVFLIFAVILAVGTVTNKLYSKIEKRFIENLTANETASRAKKNEKRPLLIPWDVVLVEFEVTPNSRFVGKTLLDAKLKEKYGVTVTLVQRGEIDYIAPDRDWVIMPFDKMYVIGSEEQIEDMRKALAEKIIHNVEENSHEKFGLKSLLLYNDSEFVGKVIRDSGIRKRISGMIVGIERNGQRILSPDSSMKLEAEDLLWVVGDIQKINELKS